MISRELFWHEPKEKAEELFKDFLVRTGDREIAKECAMFHVDQMIMSGASWSNHRFYRIKEYWIKVNEFLFQIPI